MYKQLQNENHHLNKYEEYKLIYHNKIKSIIIINYLLIFPVVTKSSIHLGKVHASIVFPFFDSLYIISDLVSSSTLSSDDVGVGSSVDFISSEESFLSSDTSELSSVASSEF